MLTKILSNDYLECYKQSRYRDRINLIAERLINLKYLDVVIVERIHEWIRFTKYCSDSGIDVPSSIDAQDVNDYIRRRFPRGSGSRRRFIKASIRIFIEADGVGKFTKRIRPLPRPTTAMYQKSVPSYLNFLRQHRGVTDKTLRKNAFALCEFTQYLSNVDVLDFNNLEAKHIHDFCMNRGNRKAITWVSYTGMIKRFLKYVFIRGELGQDLSYAVGRSKHYRHIGLHDVLTGDEVDKIMKCIDRSNAIGRRDYAILLLAARYGMRPSDIRQISLDNIHWRQNQIVFCQSKTGNQLVLPLLPDVSVALIEYLRNGRPTTTARNIFIRHKAPFEPFSPDDNLSQVMIKALHYAGMGQRSGSRGLYLLRHSLATRMVGANIPIKTIGDVLGHTRTDSTFGYTKIDLDNLRSASLSIAEVTQ